jgi:mRNA degradation ribonuclease J1/J2
MPRLKNPSTPSRRRPGSAQRASEIDLLQDHLHDDVAAFVYEKLKRRPMVLPVVVEV